MALSLILSGSFHIATAEEGLKTTYIVGKFLYSKPTKPDQIFKVQYKVINGTAEVFPKAPADIVAKVTSGTSEGAGANGTLEIQFPRNYPYTNELLGNDQGGNSPLLFVNGIQNGAPEKQVTDCFFVFSIPFSGKSEIELSWPYLLVQQPYHGDDISGSCLQKTTINASAISPLLQVRAGVSAKEIVCKDGYELLMHPSGKPLCATPPTVKILKERWNI